MQINQVQFAAVVETAKAKAAGNAKWIRAIDRAAEGILSGELIVTTLKHGALVTSENGSYVANGSCGCRAAQHGHKECRHRAAARLMAIYEEETARAAVSPADERATLIESIKASWSRKFPTDNLADELMRRFRVNQLSMLADDMLQGVLAAIA
jgi:hypothetical protein